MKFPLRFTNIANGFFADTRPLELNFYERYTFGQFDLRLTTCIRSFSINKICICQLQKGNIYTAYQQQVRYAIAKHGVR